jgi:hypothetical protein
MKRSSGNRRCSYVVPLDRVSATTDELRDFAEYLSLVASTDIDVVVVDGSPAQELEENRRVLRWVARHVAARPQHRVASGALDPVRMAIDVAACEKVIVADREVRYCADSLDDICLLLDIHEVVEPQDYYDPLPWWGGIDAGRMLVHRGIDPLPDHGSTFGFRRSAVRGLRAIDGASPARDHVRRLASQGADVFSAADVFVRRIPPMLQHWWQQRPILADVDFVIPAKTVFFLTLLPVAIVLAVLGGAGAAGGYAGAIACASMALAVRGRNGAAPFFPWRACLYAPLWVLERSITVHWALWRRLTSKETRVPPAAVPAATPMPTGRSSAR